MAITDFFSRNLIFEIVKRPIEYLEVLNLSKNLITRISNETFEGLIKLRGLDLRKMVIFIIKWPFCFQKHYNL